MTILVADVNGKKPDNNTVACGEEKKGPRSHHKWNCESGQPKTSGVVQFKNLGFKNRIVVVGSVNC